MGWMIWNSHTIASIVNVAFLVGKLANLPAIPMLPRDLGGLSSNDFGQSLEFGEVKA